MSIILWLDPGTTDTGYAIVEKNRWSISIIDYGVIVTTPKVALSDKLREIYIDLEEVIKKYRPEIAGVEKLFFTRNAKTAIDVAQSRWVMLLGLRNNAIPIIEYSPSQIKKAVCWNGNAQKKQVQNALKLILKLTDESIQDDAADALAVAYITALGV